MAWVERGKTVKMLDDLRCTQRSITFQDFYLAIANIKKRVRMGHCCYIAKNTYTWTKVLVVVLCFHGLCYIILIDVTHPIWFQWTQADLAMVQDGIGTSLVKTRLLGKVMTYERSTRPTSTRKKPPLETELEWAPVSWPGSLVHSWC